MKIIGLDHIVLRVRDLDRMLHFYRDGLGCPLERSLKDFGLYQLRAGAALIDLVTVDGPLGQAGGAAPGAEGRNLDHFCLAVAPFDAEALIRRLSPLAQRIDPVARRYGAQGFGPSLYVTDPEGNVVELKGPAETP